MATERKCPECQAGGSANRKGKPGRCVGCIDKRYRQLGWNPIEPYVSSEHARQCLCTECDRAELVPYTEIRNSNNRYCDWCSCRRMYEQGLVSDPSKWDVTVEQAAEIVLGEDFLARSPAGEVLDAVGLAAQMEHVWSLVAVECVICGTVARRSVSRTLGSRSNPGRSRCSYCFSLPLASWQDEFFTAHRLLRDHEGYARFGQRVAASCLDCGADRSISVSELKSGVAPCLGCAEATDPDAVHVVYVMHFPVLRARKVGITSTEVRHDRIAFHEAQGGVLLEQQEVPNREAARTVEDCVLRAVRAFPSGCASRDFPQGGFTETWSHDGPAVDLACVIERLERDEAPGFDRLRKLWAYFDSEPATIEELVEFRHIEVIEVDGTQVHQVGFSEPLEQVLRKIRSRRLAGGVGATETA
ncbi:hypothetical protein ACWC9H_21505 [Streptomyces sp. NPDC001251]|uniref:hypothetical protein n=1 Tax=Streptomyces sp. CB01201 TaxID=2020324 RepID=UPI00131D6A24|nr:hypothetical protein [Streptomyces sp. CB01201]